MGNESSRPEMPEGRSRSLSPLPRDDQLLHDTDDMPLFPSTMPVSFVAANRGSAPPGAPGSLAWRRRRRRSRGLSPESVTDEYRSPSPEQRPLNASQPAPPAATTLSPEQAPLSATQPEPSTRKKSRSSKNKSRFQQADETRRIRPLDGDAIQEFRKRMRRSAAPSPFHREDANQLSDEPEPTNLVEDASELQDSSPKRRGLGKKDKGKNKEVIRAVIPPEASFIDGHSTFDFGHESPPSAQPLRKRDRRESESKPRKKRKTALPPDVGSNVAPEADTLGESFGKAGPEHASDDLAPGDDIATEPQNEIGPPGAAHTQTTVPDEYQSAGVPSQPSQSDSGYAEPDGRDPSGLKPTTDTTVFDDPPHYEEDDPSSNGDEEKQDDEDSISVASEPHRLPAVSDDPVSPAASRTGDEEPNDQAEEIAPVHSTPPEPSAKSTVSRHSAKRKTKTPFFPRQEEGNVKAFAELPLEDIAALSRTRQSKKTRKAQSPAQGEAGPPAMTQKTRRKKSKKQPEPDTAADDSDAQLSTEKSQYQSGPLSETEQNQITRAVERFREDEGLTQEEINEVIHDNPQKSGQPINRQLWASIQDACPSRPRKKLISWCRQRFHNFAARGTWTQEQDDELVELIEKHGKKWSHIAGLINRYQKDVRDRWRNYLVCRATVKTDVWSEGEEERFRELVGNSIEKIRAGLSENSAKPPEELINWLTISEAMGHTRSRLQCMEKWKRMRAAEPLHAKVPTVLPSGLSWRLERARADLRRITVDDKYALICEIRDSGVGTDAKIDWKQIVHGTFGGKYERQALLVTWGRLRNAVPDQEGMTTRDCAWHLCEMYEREGDFGNDTENELAEDAASFSNDHHGKGKEVIRPMPADDSISGSRSQMTDQVSSEDKRGQTLAAKDSSSVSKELRPKRDKTKRKSNSIAQSSQASSPFGKAADEDTVMEDHSAAKLQAQSAKVRTHLTEREESPELGTAPRQPSPSEEAQAARSRRRDRRGSIEEKTSSKSKEKDTSPPTPKSTRLKGAKRPRRGSLPHDILETPKSKKQMTSKIPSAFRAKVNGAKASDISGTRDLATGGRSWSVISSDMDDMEDIPATLPTASQASH